MRNAGRLVTQRSAVAARLGPGLRRRDQLPPRAPRPPPPQARSRTRPNPRHFLTDTGVGLPLRNRANMRRVTGRSRWIRVDGSDVGFAHERAASSKVCPFVLRGQESAESSDTRGRLVTRSGRRGPPEPVQLAQSAAKQVLTLSVDTRGDVPSPTDHPSNRETRRSNAPWIACSDQRCWIASVDVDRAQPCSGSSSAVLKKVSCTHEA